MKKLLSLNVLLSLLLSSFGYMTPGEVSLSHLIPEFDVSISYLQIGSFDEEKVEINWNVTGNAQDFIFIVQRKTGNSEYQNLGGLRGSSSKSYAFFDLIPEKNHQIYYRVKVLKIGVPDFLIYSKVKSFKYPTPLQTYPNPAQDKVVLKIPHEVDKAFTIQIMNVSGRVLMQKELDGSYEREVTLPIQELMKGPYMIKLSSGNRFWSTLMMKN